MEEEKPLACAVNKPLDTGLLLRQVFGRTIIALLVVRIGNRRWHLCSRPPRARLRYSLLQLVTRVATCPFTCEQVWPQRLQLHLAAGAERADREQEGWLLEAGWRPRLLSLIFSRGSLFYVGRSLCIHSLCALDSRRLRW